MKRTLKTAFSTCPNDTFIFDAMVHHKIDTGGMSFDYTLRDIDELNILASENSFDIIKISYARLPSILDNYVALKSGGAMGFNCGPMLVAKDPEMPPRDDQIRVVIPGKDTTANYLLERYFPHLTLKKVTLFSEIEDAVVKEMADAGVIIHESRFTYKSKGLSLIADLGNLWHKETNLPVPLGCIAVKRSLMCENISEINRLMKESVIYALNNPVSSSEFVLTNADSLSREVINQHISLYVNDYTINAGNEGKLAVRLLLAGKIQADAVLFSDEIQYLKA